MSTFTQVEIKSIIVNEFKISNIRYFCHDLGVDLEVITGEKSNREEIAVAVVEYFERRGRLDELIQKIQVLRASSATLSARQLKTHSSPFKFLDYFEEADSQLFYGRESDLAQVIPKILRARLFVITGESGSGKTSLLLAGINPELRRRKYLTIYVRLVDDPLHNVKYALKKLGGEPDHSSSRNDHSSQSINLNLSENLSNLVKTVQEETKKPIILSIDQFEQFFSRFSVSSRRRFISELIELLRDSYTNIGVILILREDKFVLLHDLKDQIPRIFENTYYLKRLNENQARDAIRLPLEQFNLKYEENLINAIVKDLSQDGNIQPPQLQIVCEAIFHQLQSTSKTIAQLLTYNRLGEADQILANYLENALGRLPKQEQNISKKILTALVTLEKTRDLLSTDEIKARIKTKSSSFNEALSHLVNLRLIRPIKHQIEEKSVIHYELAHDTLAPRIYEWISESERKARYAEEILRHGVRNWNSSAKLLLRPEELELISLERINPSLKLNSDEKQLIFRSAINQNSEIYAWINRLERNEEELQESSSFDFVLIIKDLINHGNNNEKILAAELIEYFSAEELSDDLQERIYYDENEFVRKVASTTFAKIDQKAKKKLFLRLSNRETRSNSAMAIWGNLETLQLSVSERLRILLIIVGQKLVATGVQAAKLTPRFAMIIASFLATAILLFFGLRSACTRNILQSDMPICEAINPPRVSEVEPLRHEMVSVPAGQFLSNVDGTFVAKNLEAFQIDKYEVTNAQYLQCVIADVCRPPLNETYDLEEFQDYPVTNISLDEAKIYCDWIGGHLPSNDQWEKAAIGNNEFLFPWGNEEIDGSRANICDALCPESLRVEAINDGFSEAAPVGNFPSGASPFAVGDLIGNVWEWTNNGYTRGGSWMNDKRLTKASSQVEIDGESRLSTVGFRCIKN